MKEFIDILTEEERNAIAELHERIMDEQLHPLSFYLEFAAATKLFKAAKRFKGYNPMKSKAYSIAIFARDLVRKEHIDQIVEVAENFATSDLSYLDIKDAINKHELFPPLNHS